MNDETRAGLQQASEEITSALREYFAGGGYVHVSGRLSEVLGTLIVEEPSDGLTLRVRHWSIPEDSILDVFIPAYSSNAEEVGLLEPALADGGQTIMDGVDLVIVHLLEEFETGGFQNKASKVSSDHLYAELYP